MVILDIDFVNYEKGIKSVQYFLRAHHIDAFLVLTKINRQYLSGFTGSAGALLIKKNKAELYVDDRYTIRAKRESNLPVKNLKALKLKVKIGIEDKITLREFLKIQKMTRRIEVTSNVVENLRAVKSAEEIRNIKKGSQIIDATFGHIVKLLKNHNAPSTPSYLKRGKGELSEMVIAQEIARIGKKLGADGLAFDPIVAFGANAAAPHHFSSKQKIGKNNFLLLDFGFLINGYHSDFTRTLFVGRPSKKQEKIYKTVLGAQLAAIEKINAGIKASEIDKTARGIIARAGFGKYFTHNTGHGVGLEIHELPNFSPDSADRLQKDMVVTVEPGIYIPKFGGVRIEDMVRIGGGAEIFSNIPKDLKSMIIK